MLYTFVTRILEAKVLGGRVALNCMVVH